jgi:CyaY protein
VITAIRGIKEYFICIESLKHNSADIISGYNMITSSQFIDLIDKTYAYIEEAIEQAHLEIDIERSENVLTLELENGHKIIFTPQSTYCQLWLASKTKGIHFDYENNNWYARREFAFLSPILSQLLSEELHQPINLEINLD